MSETIRERFFYFIEQHTHEKLILSHAMSQTLDSAIESCFNTKIDYKRIYSNCEEARFFDYVFQTWKANFRVISAPHLGTQNVSLTIMGVNLPLSQSLVAESESLFSDLEARCEFQLFVFP